MPRKPDARLEGRIVDAAYQLWSRGGQHALTMRAVAKAAQTTTPTLYQRFSDKHELIQFLRQRSRQRMFQALQPAKTTLEACQLGLRFALSNGNEYLLFSSDWAQRLAGEEHLPSFEFLKARLAQDLGGLPADHSRLALSLVCQVHGTAVILLGSGMHEPASREIAAVGLDACQRLISSSRQVH